ncbi:hypothetical protein [Bacterioplanoides sp.]|uniref:hypothetical protein n=1 Tax=Bacterioplanoides sp. TaxID=2066072 RepID=UPI003B5957FA
MPKILIQTLCQQWEKDQRGESFETARNQVPTTALVNPENLEPLKLDNGINIILEQRGEHRPTSVYPKSRFDLKAVPAMGTQLDRLLIYRDKPDWICFRLDGEFKQWNLKDGWAQLEYQHRYRVEDLQNGKEVIYWLYERVVINVALITSNVELNNTSDKTDNHPELNSFLSSPGLVVTLADQF